MKKIILACFACMITCCLFAQNQTVINDANAQKRSVGDFHAVHVSDGIDLYFSQGSETGVAVSASSVEFRDKIKAVVENGVLKIYIEQGKINCELKNRKFKAYVSVKNIDEINASGGSDVYAKEG